jgi:hypothetical protein
MLFRAETQCSAKAEPALPPRGNRRMKFTERRNPSKITPRWGALLILALLLVSILPSVTAAKLVPPVEAFPIEGDGRSDEFPDRPQAQEPTPVSEYETWHGSGPRSVIEGNRDLIDALLAWVRSRVALHDWSHELGTRELGHGR